MIKELVIDCPHCVGKGYIAWPLLQKIKHLVTFNYSLNRCPYCHGFGVVDLIKIGKISVCEEVTKVE